jgi:EAL domain-containing protein (putative c-di-GMP-specific phosphodiesterase class I)
MSDKNKSFNLHWHQYDQYWIGAFAKAGQFSPAMAQALAQAGLQPAGTAMAVKAPRDWKPAWDKIYEVLTRLNMMQAVEVGVMPADDSPLNLAAMDRRSVESVQALAESLWLGEALLEERIVCYLQPVVSARDKIFGYESFARVKGRGKEVIGGDKIIAASKILNIEYMIDRHLHVQAIKTFVASDFNGFLFVNFFPGFIHRPAVYLEGLSDTAKQYGVIAKNIVLDFTKSENPHDIAHLRSVCEYGRSRGYSIALDDIESFEGAQKLMPQIRPDFVKIDMQLARRAGEPRARDTIRHIVELVHNSGGTVIGEGVETEEMHEQLKNLGVDLFQGYFFSPPVPVETVLKRSTGTK